MTRTISLIIGIAVTALAVAVPAALGEGRLAGSSEPVDFWNYQSGAKVADTTPGVAPQDLATLFAGSQPNGVAAFYANERATLATQGTGATVSRPDSHETTVAVAKFGYIDAAERAARINSLPSRDVVLLSGDDHVTSQPIVSTQPVATSGRDLEWPQVGIGFGVGIMLLLGLGLAMRAAHVRPFAH
jgi:hypothetical protein